MVYSEKKFWKKSSLEHLPSLKEIVYLENSDFQHFWSIFRFIEAILVILVSLDSSKAVLSIEKRSVDQSLVKIKNFDCFFQKKLNFWKIRIFWLDAPNELIFRILPFLIARNPNLIEFLTGKTYFTICHMGIYHVKITLYNGQRNFKSQKFLHFRITRIEKRECTKN